MHHSSLFAASYILSNPCLLSLMSVILLTIGNGTAVRAMNNEHGVSQNSHHRHPYEHREDDSDLFRQARPFSVGISTTMTISISNLDANDQPTENSVLLLGDPPSDREEPWGIRNGYMLRRGLSGELELTLPPPYNPSGYVLTGSPRSSSFQRMCTVPAPTNPDALADLVNRIFAHASRSNSNRDFISHSASTIYSEYEHQPGVRFEVKFLNIVMASYGVPLT
ncbi:hypothetical protein F5878DRAFT_201116 [Lentinula raphanica]|uniref:Uncharacterized protein n=1 Tax=Lentinula raphanica TaxID=153919 RepID=A0AA38PJA2_9AGAR|nr:hypothetical protein F5878DRAFT_201116 [Lentinula raphanica]